MAYPQLRKCGVYHAALTLPTRTISDKNRLADQRLKGVNHQITFREAAAVITQNLSHQFRLVKQHGRASGITQITKIKSISLTRHQLEQVAIAMPQNPSESGQRRQRFGMGRDKVIAIGHSETPGQQIHQYARAL